MTDAALTGRVEVGKFVMEVGGLAGSRLYQPAGQERRAPPPELVLELRRGLVVDPPAVPIARIESTIEDANEAAAKTERALNLFTSIAQGALDPSTVISETSELLDVLRRLDRADRYEDALRLARAMASLLALTQRFAALVESLRIALRGARALSDPHAEAWVLHEFGTLGVSVENEEVAKHLGEARRIREQLGDRQGLSASDHNIAVSQTDPSTGLFAGDHDLAMSPTDPGTGLFASARGLRALLTGGQWSLRQILLVPSAAAALGGVVAIGAGALDSPAPDTRRTTSDTPSTGQGVTGSGTPPGTRERSEPAPGGAGAEPPAGGGRGQPPAPAGGGQGQPPAPGDERAQPPAGDVDATPPPVADVTQTHTETRTQTETHTQTQPPPPGFRVIEAWARADPFSGVVTCDPPVEIMFRGRISVAGGSGRVTYRWIRSDGASVPVETLFFSEPGSRDVTDSWNRGGNPGDRITGWQALRIIDPAPQDSPPARFDLTCGSATSP